MAESFKIEARVQMSDFANHEKFMQAALKVAQTALDQGEFPVGCVMVSENRIVSVGARANSQMGGNELDHAELVALRALQSSLPETDFSKVTAYSTMEPCLMCFSALILNGIRNIVYGYEDVMGGGSSLDLSSLPPLYSAMQVNVISGVCRQESLKLFKLFFLDGKNHYCRDSLLARYTIDQNSHL